MRSLCTPFALWFLRRLCRAGWLALAGSSGLVGAFGLAPSTGRQVLFEAETVALSPPIEPTPAPSWQPVTAQEKPQPALADLRRDLRSEYGDKRRRAVTELARMGGKDAMELVIEALSDEDAQVADEAELRLPEFEDAGVLEWVLGKGGLGAKDPWVRLRAAGAAGKMVGPVPLRPLVKALDRRNPGFTRSLLWSMESLGNRGALSGLAARGAFDPVAKLVAKGTPDPVRAAAIAALAELDPPGAMALLPKARGYGGAETLCAALSAEAALGGPGLGDQLANGMGHASPVVRAHAARLVGLGYGGRPALALLAARLGAEPRPAVALTVAAALSQATGQKHGRHQKSWERAIADLPADWTAKVHVGDADSRSLEKPVGASVAALGRLEPLSDRLAILVDFSGSLWNERADGTKRKDALDPEVTALLGRLTPESRFLLVPYTHESLPFEDEPTDASLRNVRRAQDFFDKARMTGKGNVWDAIQFSLASPEIDRILIVTDGAPTGGHRWNIDLMVELLTEQTRFRPVLFDLVLFDAPKGLVRRWEPLAERTGGRLVVIDR